MLSQKSRQALDTLKEYSPYIDHYQTSKRSAVLVALVANPEGELEVILTVRSSALRTNAGDSAFPGGKKDPEDADLIATAKREAFEEVGLPISEPEFLTSFPPILSRHMQVVTPIVAFCPHLATQDVRKKLYPNPGEVVAIFTAPLESFLSPNPPECHESFDMDWIFSPHRIHRFERCGRHNFLLGQPDGQSSSTGYREAKKAASLGALATRVEEGMPSTFSPPTLPLPEELENSGTGKVEEDEEEEEEAGRAVDRSKAGWPVYGLTASVLIEVATVAYQREPDFEVYAPGQMIDQDKITEWYNGKYGPSARM
ncbi:peroxisomal coenzyme A diphosphatase NUDT7 [Entomortierella parvispora]|uniref:Peroxisomal coenzyme A diphosphatase NUDT7 n=1 Tax=Entomortierella parvispora TaxID=205924 RepID=A0A9P3H404_9FUNG|nr:peroxisomal coenzyme A diphosphatase NUDT7 [Entomortierella parvispora]